MEALLIGVAIVVGIPLVIWTIIGIAATWPLLLAIGIIISGVAIGGGAGGLVVAVGIALLVFIALFLMETMGKS